MKRLMKSAWKRYRRKGKAAGLNTDVYSVDRPTAITFYSRFYSRRIEKPV